MCTPPPSPDPLPTIAAPGEPARVGACVRTHGPRRRPRSLFLASRAVAAPYADLAPSGNPPPSEREGPERSRSLLSAAGGRVATFVIANRPTWFCSNPGHAWCWWLPSLPRASSSPSRLGFLPFPPSSLSLGTPSKGVWGGPKRVGGRGRAATMQPRRGSGRGGGAGSRVVCLFAGPSPAAGVCSHRGRGAGGTIGTRAASRDAADPGTLRPLLARLLPGRCLLARPGRDSAALLE